MVVERLKGCDNIVALAQELGLHRRLLYKWRDQLEPVEHQEPTASTPELRQQVRQLKRQPPPGLVHHSDRGVQYASEQYIAILEKHGMIPSMSRPANPYDNASCESFIKTLKREEIYANAYDDLEHLRANIEEFIEQYYNRQRLHSALGYRSPEEFERQRESRSWGADSRSATMEFFEKETKTSTEMLGKGTQWSAPL
jgi:transposase InsO family protein